MNNPSRMKAQTLLRYFLIFGVLYFAHSAFAAPQNESRELAAHTEVYKITDGYGEYAGQGSTKIQAQSGAREACVMAKITAYESRFGVTPDPDTADLMIDACINK